MTLPRHINIDRLHKCIELIRDKERRPSRIGITSAYLVLMAHEIELGDANNTYVYVSLNNKKAKEALDAFVEYITHVYGAVILTQVSQQSMRVATITGQQFIFVGMSGNVSSRFRGLSVHRVFLDVHPMHQTRTLKQFDELVTNMTPSLACNQGDII